jgi:hypothetical protein
MVPENVAGVAVFTLVALNVAPLGPTVKPRSVVCPTLPTVDRFVLPTHRIVPPSMTRLAGSEFAAPSPETVPPLFKLSTCQLPPRSLSGPVHWKLLPTDF